MDGKMFMQRAYEAIIGHDFEQAIQWFSKAVADDPSNASYHYSLSITYARSNKLAKAIHHAAEACRLEPDNGSYELHMNTLECKRLLHAAGRWLYKGHPRIGEAENMLLRAAKLDSLSVEALLMLALACGLQGRYARAVEVLQEAGRLDPQHQEVIRLLAEYKRLADK